MKKLAKFLSIMLIIGFLMTTVQPAFTYAEELDNISTETNESVEEDDTNTDTDQTILIAPNPNEQETVVELPVELNIKSITVLAKDVITLRLVNAEADKVKWSSSNKKIAKVSKGVVTAKKAGKVKITAKYKKKNYVCKITVKKSNLTKNEQAARQKARDFIDTNLASRILTINHLRSEGFDLEVAEKAVDGLKVDWKKQVDLVAQVLTQTFLFSKNEIIDRLVSDGHDAKLAKEAINKLDINWNEYAVFRAKFYLENYLFSKQGLMDQLLSDKFTKKQAKFALSCFEVDWKQVAAVAAKMLYDLDNAFTREELIIYLESYKFTRKEAEFGVDSVGLVE